MSKLKLSIIIINYKSEDYLADCLAKIESRSNYEIIMVDNEGNKKFLEKFSSYPRIKTLPFTGNLGFAGGNNRGISAASGEYIMTLNADAFLTPNYIDDCLDFLDKHHGFASIQGKLLSFKNKDMIDATGNYLTNLGFAFAKDHDEKDYHPASNEIFGVCAAAAIYRRRALEKIKFEDEYFDDDFFAYLEDVDLDWRLRTAGFKAYFLSGAVAFHIREATTKSNYRKVQALRNIFFLNLKNDLWHRLIWKVPFYFCLNLCFLYFKNLGDFFYLFKKMVRKRRFIFKHRQIKDIKSWLKPFPFNQIK